ncbi:MAG TPA: citramalate synthase [Anaerolineae bacterium]|nr:citramalate synthase [Anaerolineae bacterium]
MKSIQIYDTTLRDGTQREGLALTASDKLKVAQLLDDLGVAYIEGGWPGSNPKDVEFFQRAKTLNLKNARIAAFGSTMRVGARPEDDANILALIEAETPVCTVVGKTWTLHVEQVLRTTQQENLRLIRESLAYLKSKGREVIYDAEHFFDGFRANPEYALATLNAAREGGADSITLCDTNGGSLPWQIQDAVNVVRGRFPNAVIGIHTHNDGELAVANTLAAVQVGATQVQGTINGYGERCGNANLCAIIPDLEIKMGYQALPEGNLEKLTVVARSVAEIANIAPDEFAAYVGRNAFAHKGGIHVAAQRRNAMAYQHIDPMWVGNSTHVVVSELSGRGNLLSKADELSLKLDERDPRVARVLQQIKDKESQGYHFEGADASVELLLLRAAPDYSPPFELIDYMTVVEHRQGRGMVAEASIKLRVKGEIVHTAAEGNGPVNAMDIATRKALASYYPALNDFSLVDYKVRILDGHAATGATTRVLIDTANHQRRWSTVGASTNIIDASWLALQDAIEYGVLVAAKDK